MTKMAPQSEARISDAGLMMLLGGRTYGESLSGDLGYFEHLKQMTIPPALKALSQSLERKSALLSLSGDVSDVEIHEAYGHDLGLLIRYRDGFNKTIKVAVLGRAPSDHEDAQEFLELATKQIAAVVHKPLLSLNAERLKLPSAEQLSLLQADFKQDAEALEQSVAIWLHMLAENEHVSVIERLSPTALRYHFFKMESKRDVVVIGKHDPGPRMGGRTVTTESEVTVEVIGERRSHTVVDAKSYALNRYPEHVPQRIADLIGAIPNDVRDFVTVIGGNVTEEDVTRQFASGKVDHKTESVFVPDPALALFGEYALGGWGGSEAEPTLALYKGHKLAQANTWLVWSLVVVVALAAAAGLTFGGLRIAAAVGIIGAILVALHQVSLRLGNRN